MALRKRGKIWWIDIPHQGRRVRKSTGSSNKLDAKQFHDKVKADLWKEENLDLLPKKTWIDAVTRWLSEQQHKRSICDDILTLKWLDKFLRQHLLCEIDQDLIEKIAKAKEATGVKPATINRMLEIVRAILRKAEREWGWLNTSPLIRMRKEENRRIRWLTEKEVSNLLSELPSHMRAMAEFTLATGLRASNVMGLQWSQVDVAKRHALIHADQAKGRKPIPVPLNSTAIKVLQNQLGKHAFYVFTYNGHPVKQCNTKAWSKALKRAGIENFKWHDLRHTWASWHVQQGTTLQELQILGGWTCFDMVLRYAHLSSQHLQNAAERISVTKTSH